MKNLEKAKQLIDQLAEAVKENTTELYVDNLSHTLTSVVLEDVEKVNDELMFEASTWFEGTQEEAEAIVSEWNEITGTDKFKIELSANTTTGAEVFLISGLVNQETLDSTTIEDEFIVDNGFGREGYVHGIVPQGNKFTGGNIVGLIEELQTLLTWLSK